MSALNWRPGGAPFTGSTFAISFEHNIAEVERELVRTERWKIPYVTSAALSATAFDARAAEQAKIVGVFDRPNSMTQKAVLYRKANKDNLTYLVFVRDEAGRGTPPAKYLEAQVLGGMRRAKPYELLLRRVGILGPDEFTIPAIGFRRDRYGNLPGSVISKILSQLKARRDNLQNTTTRSRQRTRKRGGAEYFVPNGRSGLLPGIYERLAGRKVRAVLIFVRAVPSYRKRYDFGQAARAKALRVFGPHFLRQWEKMKDR